MHLTPERLAATYEFLRTLPPFCRWCLPPADEIEFHVTKSRHYAGEQCGNRIRLSLDAHDDLEELLTTMAHEMIHLRFYLLGRRSGHGRAFGRCADQVCRRFGWKRKGF